MRVLFLLLLVPFARAKNHLENFVIGHSKDILLKNDSNILKPNQTFIHTLVQSGNCIYIQMMSPEKCRSPLFYGRLSGREVSIIEWESIPDVSGGIQGCWKTSERGQFYMELVLLRCDVLQHNFTKQCIHIHTLTLPNASIVSQPKRNSTILTGRWVGNQTHNEPLHFRFQTPSCFYGNRKRPSCQAAQSITQFDPYIWAWADDFQKPNYNINTKVCIFGDSHAIVLEKHVRKHFYHRKAISVRWAVDLSDKLLLGINQSCNVQVIEMGQWPASMNSIPHPQSAQQFGEEMASALIKFQNLSSLIVLNTHYSPLSATASECPPTDWRTPDVIDAYNRELKQICLNYSIQFVDTNSQIFKPLIDSGVDFSHYRNKVGAVEATLVASLIEKMLLDKSKESHVGGTQGKGSKLK
jgi:hypothetical protein